MFKKNAKYKIKADNMEKEIINNGNYIISVETTKVYTNEDNELYTTTLSICNFEKFGKYGTCFEITKMHKEKDTEATVERLKKIAAEEFQEAWK